MHFIDGLNHESRRCNEKISRFSKLKFEHQRAISIALVCLFALPVYAQTSLPSAWLGTWRGTVQAESLANATATFEMELQIRPTSDPDRIDWIITYEGSSGKSVRDYQLVITDPKRNLFELDERNGIRLTTSRFGDSLFTHFTTGGQTLSTRYTLLRDNPPAIEFELLTGSLDQSRKSNANDVEVTSLPFQSRQSAKLVRVASTTNEADSAFAPFTKWRKLTTDAYRGKQDDLYFVNAQLGWYVNGAGKIYKTTDGGETWLKQLEQPGTYFRCVAFIDENHGFAGNIGPGYFPNVTDTQPLYETKDGGNNWHPVSQISGEPVVGLCALQVLREEFINAGQLDRRIRLIGVGRVGGPSRRSLRMT